MITFQKEYFFEAEGVIAKNLLEANIKLSFKLSMSLIHNKMFRLCKRYRKLTNRDDYFQATFGHFEASVLFETTGAVAKIALNLKQNHHNQAIHNIL